MTRDEAPATLLGPPPRSAPAKLDLLASMFSATGRGAVPIRRAFVQSAVAGEDGTRRGPLAAMVGDRNALNAYLLVHALASSSAPYTVQYQSRAWVTVSGLTETAELSGAKSRWSRSMTKLEGLNLIARSGRGRGVRYVLLHESGDGKPYTRPKSSRDGNWFSLPYTYWINGWEDRLTQPERIMLLIALSMKPAFELPYARVSGWYGVSESTAKRGIGGLVGKHVLQADRRYVPDANSPTLWRQVTRYTPVGEWSLKARQAAMRVKRNERPAVEFEVEDDPEVEGA